jgi:putative membrane protein
MGGVAAGPWTWHPHPLAWLVVVALGVAGRRTRHRLTYAAGLVALAGATTWPLADLARRWSVLALVGSHLLLSLGAVPLLLLGLPDELGARLTARPAVDEAVVRLTHPLAATAVFNAGVVGLHLPPVVELEARSVVAFAAAEVLLGLVAVVMWLVVIPAVPGLHRPSGLSRVGYLLVQSIVPNVPAAFLTFSRAPLFPAYVGRTGRLGMSALLDQQLAGALAKIAGVAVLWAVAGVVFFRTTAAELRRADPEPLVWADVERQLARAEWRSLRGRRASGSHPAG